MALYKHWPWMIHVVNWAMNRDLGFEMRVQSGIRTAVYILIEVGATFFNPGRYDLLFSTMIKWVGGLVVLFKDRAPK